MVTLEDLVRADEAHEERFDRLEEILGSFIVQTGVSIRRMNAAVNRMDTSIEQMGKSIELMRVEAVRDRHQWNERFEKTNAQLAQDRQEWNKRFEETNVQLAKDRQAWNKRFEEMDTKAEKHRQEIDAQAAKDRQEWNKRWGELANKLGTIVEDIVAPNIPGIAKNFFNIKLIDDFMVRRKVRHRSDRSKQREFDVILVGTTAAGEELVLINETKSTPRLGYIESFVKALQEIDDYFPEYQDKTIIPIFASLYLGEDVTTYLTRNHVYAMSMGEEAMTLINFDDCQKHEQGVF